MFQKSSALLYWHVWIFFYRAQAAPAVVYSFITRRGINEYTTDNRVINEYTTDNRVINEYTTAGAMYLDKQVKFLSLTGRRQADTCTYETATGSCITLLGGLMVFI